MVVGEGRPYLGALVVLNEDKWPGFAHEIGVDPDSPASLRDERVLKAAARRIAAALKGFPGYAKIRRVHLSLEPWSVENGLVTPTLKVKRRVVMEHYGEQVDELYRGGPAA